MAVSKKLLKLLNDQKAKHEVIAHKKVFTAFDKAATLKVKASQVAKTLAVSLDREYAIVVVSSHRNLDFSALKKVCNTLRKKGGLKAVKKVGIAREQWIKKNLKGAKPGAVPPFGVLWKLPTFVDRALLKEKAIILNGGDHKESIKMRPKDFLKALPDAIVGSFSRSRK